MNEKNKFDEQLEKYFQYKTKEEILMELKENGKIIYKDLKTDDPYIQGFKIKLSELYAYNPKYGDDRICQCGDPYHRHFDPYENNYPTGCKYCGCQEFIEENKSEDGATK